VLAVVNILKYVRYLVYSLVTEIAYFIGSCYYIEVCLIYSLVTEIAYFIGSC